MNKGFTLVELVIVIVILGILALIAAPKCNDIVGGGSYVNGTKANLAVIRETLKLKVSKNYSDGITAMPAIDSTDFRDGRFPKNLLNNNSLIETVTAPPTDQDPTSDTYGWWYDTASGKVGAYTSTRTAFIFGNTYRYPTGDW